MNNKIKIIAGFIGLALIVAGASFAYNALSSNVDTPDLIQRESGSGSDSESESDKILAFDFTVTDADNNKIKLSELFGKPIVLNFWASWCSPCKQEMPEFNKVYEELGNEVTFAMIDLVDGFQETVQTGKKYIEAQGFTFPVYYDTEGEAGAVYGITSIPTTIFIDKDGYIVTGARGAIDEESLRRGISMIWGGAEQETDGANIRSQKPEYRKISADEAKKMLEDYPEAILLDVRTEEEFAEERIPGAVLLPDYEIGEKAFDILPDKNAVILVYCRSGNRSESAARDLADMGYTNIYDFGGIIDWSYDTES